MVATVCVFSQRGVSVGSAGRCDERISRWGVVTVREGVRRGSVLGEEGAMSINIGYEVPPPSIGSRKSEGVGL